MCDFTKIVKKSQKKLVPPETGKKILVLGEMMLAFDTSKASIQYNGFLPPLSKMYRRAW